jgi:hypothetical protein
MNERPRLLQGVLHKADGEPALSEDKHCDVHVQGGWIREDGLTINELKGFWINRALFFGSTSKSCGLELLDPHWKRLLRTTEGMEKCNPA